jgi:hypothetical protein
MKKRLVPVLIACAGSAALLYWLGRARPLWVDEEMLLLNVRDRRFTQLAGALWLDQSAPLGWLALERNERCDSSPFFSASARSAPPSGSGAAR